MQYVSLDSLRLINFKNYTEVQLTFNKDIVAITGNNGVGKTNILDAIYTMAMCKSSISNRIDTIIREGAPFVRIESCFAVSDKQKAESLHSNLEKSTMDNQKHLKVNFKCQRGGKKSFDCDGKTYKKLRDHIGKIPTIMIAPDDIQLVIGGSVDRRRLIDSTLCQLDRVYLEALSHYNAILRQRNALLKSDRFDLALLKIYNSQMIPHMNSIAKRRISFIESFQPIVQTFYEAISSGKENISLLFKSQLLESDPELLLDLNLEKDRILKRTTSGIHRDDIILHLDQQKAKDFASQGQKKSLLIALKLAQFQYLKNELNIAPIVLLDDLFDKLDSERVASLVSLLARESYGQIFITDTGRSRLENAIHDLEMPIQWVEVDNGHIVEENSTLP